MAILAWILHLLLVAVLIVVAVFAVVALWPALWLGAAAALLCGWRAAVWATAIGGVAAWVLLASLPEVGPGSVPFWGSFLFFVWPVLAWNGARRYRKRHPVRRSISQATASILVPAK
jgi:hypothetical protein